MSSIINASTSSGVTVTSDTSGILQLQSNGTTIMTVGSTGVSTQVGAPAFSAYASSSQSFSSNTDTKITFDVEEFDTNNNFASSRFTPTVAGYYFIAGAVNWSVNSSASRFLTLRKNGSLYKVLQVITPNGTNYMNASGSCIVYLNGSTDYVELYANQNSGSTLSSGGSQSEVWFNGSMVRSA